MGKVRKATVKKVSRDPVLVTGVKLRLTSSLEISVRIRCEGRRGKNLESRVIDAIKAQMFGRGWRILRVPREGKREGIEHIRAQSDPSVPLVGLPGRKGTENKQKL